MLNKHIPMVQVARKIAPEHQEEDFTEAETRAVMCFNTGNLVFKKSHPHRRLELSNKYSDVDSFVKSLHDIY